MERQSRESIVKFTLLQALAHPRVLFLSLVYFGIVATNYGMTFWLPQIIKGFGGLTNLQTGFITAIPYVAGAVAMVYWGQRSDRERERKWHAAIPIAVAAIGIALSAMTEDPVLKMSAITLAGLGIFGVLPCFWTLPTALLTGTAAAGGIALINSVGNIAGFVGPFAMGYIKDATGSFMFGLLFIAALAVVSFIVVLALGHNPALEGHAADSAAD
jgi:nitrate/nitrite transporter NarK